MYFFVFLFFCLKNIVSLQPKIGNLVADAA